MNIFAINSFNTNPYYKKQENFFRNEKSFGLTMAKPLLNDTVSFKSCILGDTAKVAVTNELKHKGNVFLDILNS